MTTKPWQEVQKLKVDKKKINEKDCYKGNRSNMEGDQF